MNKKGVHLLPSENFGNLLNLKPESFTVLYPFVSAIHSKNHKESETLKIAFSGQSYSVNEIEMFLCFLRRQNYRIAGKRVELHVFGFNNLPKNDSHIINHGWIDSAKLVPKLGLCDVAFLPYPSNKEMLEVSLNSFPSKLATYISASLPVIYLGPPESSVMPFMDEIGIVLPVNNDSEWCNILEAKLDLNFDKQIKDVYNNFFSEDKFVRTLDIWLKRNDMNLPFEGKNQDLILKPILIRDLEQASSGIYLSITFGRAFSRILNVPKKIARDPIALVRAFSRVLSVPKKMARGPIALVSKLLSFAIECKNILIRMSEADRKFDTAILAITILLSKRMNLIRVIRKLL